MAPDGIVVVGSSAARWIANGGKDAARRRAKIAARWLLFRASSNSTTTEGLGDDA